MRIIVLLVLLSPALWAQTTSQASASQIRHKLKKLNFLGSVLYVAAHPDDENTRVIAFLANDRLASTAYLSMTRGDGGQNLIGPEIRDQLGLIRTQELLAARRIDGGEQFFTRANDFGFSKKAEETFQTWGKQEILSDVVRVFRQYQPDVIIARFPPDERAGHGHHTASAVLAAEAFDLSGKANAYPELSAGLQPWQPVRMLTNTGRWWNQSINENVPGVVALNVGSYNTLLGKSSSEIAAESRTQHKSQGFGSPGRRGDAPEFFEFNKGDKPTKDIFDGVNTTWTRVKGGEKIQPLVAQALREFSDEQPDRSIPLLIAIRNEIQKLEPGVWRTRKLAETERLIKDCLGLFAEVAADQFYAVPGESVVLSFELVNRSTVPVMVKRMQSPVLSLDSAVAIDIGLNKLTTLKLKKRLAPTAAYSTPYWLREPHGLGLFTVSDPHQIGRPENPPAAQITLELTLAGELLRLEVPVVYKWTDPVKGELGRPFEIVPPVTVKPISQVVVFGAQQPQNVSLTVRSYSEKTQRGTLSLQLPAGWRSEPAQIEFTLNKRGDESTYTFKVLPSGANGVFEWRGLAAIANTRHSQSLQTISYDHIPTQTLLLPAAGKAVFVEMKKEGNLVAYIRGAGDDIPAALRNLGYEVWEMKNEEVTPENLRRVDAVVLGVRALNTNERIRYFMPALHEFVKAGGTMVVQYNNNFDLEIDLDKIAPFSLTLSRDRVTEENSEVQILKPEHPVLNGPNKLTAADFDGWVQERGLYFPAQWDAAFEPILSMHDTGEPERKGGLLVAKYGEGHYVYTGLSFFRQLPEGVSGAYRLFANIMSLGKSQKVAAAKVKAAKK